MFNSSIVEIKKAFLPIRKKNNGHYFFNYFAGNFFSDIVVIAIAIKLIQKDPFWQILQKESEKTENF